MNKTHLSQTILPACRTGAYVAQTPDVVAEMSVARIDGCSPLYLAILHGNVVEDARSLLSMLQVRLQIDESVIGDIGPIWQSTLFSVRLGCSSWPEYLI